MHHTSYKSSPIHARFHEKLSQHSRHSVPDDTVRGQMSDNRLEKAWKVTHINILNNRYDKDIQLGISPPNDDALTPDLRAIRGPEDPEQAIKRDHIIVGIRFQTILVAEVARGQRCPQKLSVDALRGISES